MRGKVAKQMRREARGVTTGAASDAKASISELIASAYAVGTRAGFEVADSALGKASQALHILKATLLQLDQTDIVVGQLAEVQRGEEDILELRQLVIALGEKGSA